MKKVILLCLCQFIFLMAYAQVDSKKYEKKAEQKVEQRVDQKIDNAMDDALNKIEGLFKKKPKKTQEEEPVEMEEIEEVEEAPTAEERDAAQEMLDKIYGSNTEEEPYVPMENAFIGSFNMEIASFKNGKEEKHSPALVNFHFDKSKTAIITPPKNGQEARMIMNLEDNSMVIITNQNGSTSGFKMKRPNMRKAVEESMNDTKITRTGEYKTIDGYRCEKIIWEDTKDDIVTTAWVTKDIKMDWKSVAESLSASKMTTSNQNWIDGFAIESVSEEKDGKHVHKMKTRNIKIGTVDKSIFDTSGVEIMALPGMN